MLPRKKRLNKKEFDRFFSLGRRFHSPHLTLVAHASPAFQASAVAPKKIFKTAVSRNKFRRRVYDVFERTLREKTMRGAYICIAKSGAETIRYEALKEELSVLIHKTNILR
jgi:ribonuclease P protein component